jgi:hypothetical protein
MVCLAWEHLSATIGRYPSEARPARLPAVAAPLESKRPTTDGAYAHPTTRLNIATPSLPLPTLPPSPFAFNTCLLLGNVPCHATLSVAITPRTKIKLCPYTVQLAVSLHGPASLLVMQHAVVQPAKAKCGER